MSNKLVPMIYRAIIDDVIASIKSEFDDYGVGEEVLGDLQSRWENKVIASHVAEFEQSAPSSAPVTTHHYPHVSHPSMPQMHAAYPQYVPAPQAQVKSEPIENRFPLPSNMPTYIPTLPGPTLPGPSRPQAHATPAQHHYGAALPNSAARLPYPQVPAPAGNIQASSQPRMPQVDGPSSSASDSPSPPPPSQSYAPRPSHPSLPQPPQGAQVAADSEEINSDLDDSDTDGEEEDQEGSLGETDIVFCTYDKVARVKNKWKCVLKDGMIHVNGKDYLFAKCTCEFEW